MIKISPFFIDVQNTLHDFRVVFLELLKEQQYCLPLKPNFNIKAYVKIKWKYALPNCFIEILIVHVM